MSCFIVVLAVSILSLDEAASDSPIDELPSGVDAEHFSALHEHSPFSRTLFLSESIVLSGRASIDGRSVVTLIDTEEPRAFSVSQTPSDAGWKLIELIGSKDLETCIATISVDGGKVIRVRYNEERIKSATQRLHFAAKNRSQVVQARTSKTGNTNGSGGHGVPPERVDELKRISQTELPKEYNPGAGRNREESHNLHQSYVDQRMAGMSARQRGMVGQMWKQQQAVDPRMPNRGASFVRILEHVANNEPR